MDLKEITQTLLAEIHRISGSETVVGKPMKLGDATIVPVCKLTIGFGTGTVKGRGGGTTGAEGGGAGGGISVEPVAFFAVDKDGGTRLLTLKDSRTAALTRVVDLVPEVLDRVLGRGTAEGAGSGAGALPAADKTNEEGGTKRK
jgi:uncharacterized spore protein YtfJ